jgi:hypothetical protein
MSKKWLAKLQEKVANCWEWHSPALNIGFRYKPDQGDDFWEIWAYPVFKEWSAAKRMTKWCGPASFCTSSLLLVLTSL